MYLKKIITLITCAILFGGCIDDDDFLSSQIIRTYDNGFSTCIEDSILSQDYCTELRAYNAQINNSNDNRFDHTAYTPEVNLTTSLEGHWLYVDDTGTNIRQTCELNEQVGNPNNFDLLCSEAPYTDMIFNPVTNIIDISQSIRTENGEGEFEDLTYDTITTVYGTVSDLNRIEFHREIVVVWSDGLILEGRDYILQHLIRLGDTATPIGQITVEKYDFEGNLQLMEQYDVGAILEKGNAITLTGMAVVTLAIFGNNTTVKNTDSLESFAFSGEYPLYGNIYDVDLFPGVDPYLFDGIDAELMPSSSNNANAYNLSVDQFELRLRQFDYVSNDATSLNINWLINRRQATRFERGDTIGNISLSF